LSVVPLFIFMGNILAQSGIAHGLFAGADRLFGRMKGGLALATILSCGGFSAVSGSSLATAATLSRVAMPPMRKFGYSVSLASGAIAAGGTLGILIPPSVILIIYGLLTESDIGNLFIAGLLPGLLGIVLYMVAVVIAVRIKPELAPPVTQSEPMSKQDRIGVFGTLGLFVFIMGGIYSGFFTPIEAAGIGAIFFAVSCSGHTRAEQGRLCRCLPPNGGFIRYDFRDYHRRGDLFGLRELCGIARRSG
jgi:tripartite ATP-independent transporter DctM subunit